MRKPKIGICIPIRDAQRQLIAMIDTLFEYTSNFSLYICDDASRSQTRKYINTLPAKKIIRNRRQQWFSRSSNNVLIPAYLDGNDFIFLLNSDITLSKGWVKKFMEPFEDEKVMLIGSLYSPKARPKKVSVKPPAYSSGHCWCIRAEHMKTVGILNEFHFHIGSDKEYCYRLYRYGYKMITDRSTRIGHQGGASWSHNLQKLNTVSMHLLTPPRDIYILRDEKEVEKLRKIFKSKEV